MLPEKTIILIDYLKKHYFENEKHLFVNNYTLYDVNTFENNNIME